MDELISKFRELESSDFQKKNNRKVLENSYRTLAHLRISMEDGYDLHRKILPRMAQLLDKGQLKEDYTFFAILATRNVEIFTEFTEFEKRNVTLDLSRSSTLYNFCLYKNIHWILELTNKLDRFARELFTFDIYNRLVVLKCLDLTKNEFSLKSIENCLENYNETIETDESVSRLIGEMKKCIDLIRFTKELSADSVEDKEVFNVLCHKNNTLDAFSIFLDFSNCSNWPRIIRKLNEWNEESETFEIFTIFATIFDLKTIQPNVTDSVLENVQSKLMNIKNSTVLLETLEDVFSVLFLLDRAQNRFENGETVVRSVLHLLKNVVEALKLQPNSYRKGSGDHEKLIRLSRNIHDALWRFELVKNVKTHVKTSIVRYMMAPPLSLLSMCVHKSNFNRAYQVIEMFNLQNTELAKELQNLEHLRDLRNSCRKFCRCRNMRKTAPDVQLRNEETREKLLDKLLAGIADDESSANRRESEETLRKFAESNYLCHFKNEGFMNLFDIFCTNHCEWGNAELNRILLDVLTEKHKLNPPHVVSVYSKFAQNLLKITERLNLLNVSQMINSTNAPLNVVEHEQKLQFDDELILLFDLFKSNVENRDGGSFNINHASHKIYNGIEKLCASANTTTDYLKKLFSYLHAFSKVLFLGGGEKSTEHVSKGRDTSYFHLLDFNRSELMGFLIFELNVDPGQFEHFFDKLKLDFMYHLVGNCFPTINLHTEEIIAEEELFPENDLYVPPENIINYIRKRNWLLALILEEMYNGFDPERVNVNASRTSAFQNYRNLKSTKRATCLFDNNEMIASLQREIPLRRLNEFIEKSRSNSPSNSADSLETAEEIIEEFTPPISPYEIHELLDSVTELQTRKSRRVRELNDEICTKIIREKCDENHADYLNRYNNPAERIAMFLEHQHELPATFCLEFIETILSSHETETEIAAAANLDGLKGTIEICEEVRNLLGISSWHECLVTIEEDGGAEEALGKLLETGNLANILKFLHRFQLPQDVIASEFDRHFELAQLGNGSVSKIRQLFEYFPFEYSIEVCAKLMKIAQNTNDIQFLLDYSIEHSAHCSSERSNFKSYKISLDIVRRLRSTTTSDDLNLTKLIGSPLSIFEVLVMNSRFDKLNLIAEFYAEFQQEIDAISRKYAEKTLEFRVITHQMSPQQQQQQQRRRQQQLRPLQQNDDDKLVESFSSTDSSKQPPSFVMPPNVPGKEEWVNDFEVTRCQCCENVTFSMFNRRHHCRRCGRVVCYVCSRKSRVETYGNLLVRVCADCYGQSKGSASSERSSTNCSAISDVWILTADAETDRMIREEFSFEHAPSVSLCLNVLRFHSPSKEHAEFLLKQCENLLKLLQPEVEEVDRSLVLRMLKTLAVSAKIKSQESNYAVGISRSECLLNQLELYTLFAERNCLDLLQRQRIEVATLRKLRDKLIEHEQWNLALEVSTKCGLDGAEGVFAAWGKSCLKSGSLSRAREKFQRCLDNKKTDSAEKPLKNPPLLTEIIRILESKTAVIDRELVEEINAAATSTSSLNSAASPPLIAESAVSILNKLRNLDNIARGRYYFQPTRAETYATNRPIIDTVFYNECIYYLDRYGSHQSLMEFYLKHGELDQALQYILDNNANVELFVELYVRCLKNGLVNILQENIGKIDSTLDLWKNYLRHLCRHLEKQKLFNSLYQLQLFMGDYLRAAMTCIRFYEENANNFSDLARKHNFLLKAEEHIKQIYEQEQWVEVAPVRIDGNSTTQASISIASLSSAISTNFEEKSITNPSLVMRLGEKTLNNYLNIIWRQSEVASYLADCEAAKTEPMKILESILPDSESSRNCAVPTLFGGTMEKCRIAILILLASLELERGFKITLRLIHDLKLRPGTVFCQAGKHLAKMQRFDAIIELVQLIRNTGGAEDNLSEICDEMLTLSVATLTKEKAPLTKVEDLIKLISDKATKISAYIEAKQLKTAYFFAVRFKRMSDIRRILREAELNNQPNIKSLCLKVLHAHSQQTAKE